MTIPLTSLLIGQPARIISLSEGCGGLHRSRLLDLGLTPGARVCVERANAGRSALACRIRDTVIALRCEHADHIMVRPVPA